MTQSLRIAISKRRKMIGLIPLYHLLRSFRKVEVAEARHVIGWEFETTIHLRKGDS